ncbi:Uncharacterized protein GBIM_03733, partial [Gryllus bimaculatus]
MLRATDAYGRRARGAPRLGQRRPARGGGRWGGGAGAGAGPPIVVPLLTVQEPCRRTATPLRRPSSGSPPLAPLALGAGDSASSQGGLGFGGGKGARRLLRELDKPNSLDLPCAPPLITVTCNMSEADSDTDSPAAKAAGVHAGGGGGGGPGGGGVGVAMCYLSPFSMCSRADRTASESNLSSSGYSSMASPGPSRCGSNNPLCPREVRDRPGGSGAGRGRRRHDAGGAAASRPAPRGARRPPRCCARRGPAAGAGRVGRRAGARATQALACRGGMGRPLSPSRSKEAARPARPETSFRTPASWI